MDPRDECESSGGVTDWIGVDMDEDTERWAAIPGFEGRYEASDQGRVRSLSREARTFWGTRTVRGRILSAYCRPGGYGYLTISSEDGRQYVRNVHVLVAAAFYGPRPDGLVVRHLDGDPGNNRLDNLAYGTQKENIADARRHGTWHGMNQTACLRGHEYDEANTHWNKKGSRICRRCARDRMRAVGRAKRGQQLDGQETAA